MKIAYITAGAAGMYCGSCLHDNTLAAAMMARGHEVALIPTYTPTRTDEEDVSIDRVFYGAVNVYLEQKSALFLSHTPERLHRSDVEQPRVARLGLTRRERLGRRPGSSESLTLSMAMEERGQASRARNWRSSSPGCATSFEPQTWSTCTNSMFLGLAAPLKRELGVPVLCSLQGEDIFLEDLSEPYKTQGPRAAAGPCRARRRPGVSTTATTTPHFMAEYLDDVPEDQVHVVRLGHQSRRARCAAPAHRARPPVADRTAPAVIRSMSATWPESAPEKGLHVLVDAFRLLAERGRQGQRFCCVRGRLPGKGRRALHGEGPGARLSDLGTRRPWSTYARRAQTVSRRSRFCAPRRPVRADDLSRPQGPVRPRSARQRRSRRAAGARGLPRASRGHRGRTLLAEPDSPPVRWPSDFETSDAQTRPASRRARPKGREALRTRDFSRSTRWQRQRSPCSST